MSDETVSSETVDPNAVFTGEIVNRLGGNMAIVRCKEDGETYAFFLPNDVADAELRCEKGTAVEFNKRVGHDKKKDRDVINATSVRRPGVEVKPGGRSRLSGSPSEYLLKWAYINLFDRTSRKGTPLRGVLRELAEAARDEQWYFGPRRDGLPDREALFILNRYLRTVFFKLWIDGGVIEKAEAGYACFNTGLVDDNYETIYALFERSSFESVNWQFLAFTTSGDRRFGRLVTEHFSPPPPRPKFLHSATSIVFDSDLDVSISWEHCLYDNIERDRIPYEFFEQLPRSFEFYDYRTMLPNDRAAYLRDLRRRIEENDRARDAVQAAYQFAVDKAKKRAAWNYRMAIPQYYPETRIVNILLPIQLGRSDYIDAALVVERQGQGGYFAPTMITRQMAYENARIICKPDTDWLSIDQIAFEGDDEANHGVELSEGPADDGQVDPPASPASTSPESARGLDVLLQELNLK